MSNKVGYPEDRLSYAAAHTVHVPLSPHVEAWHKSVSQQESHTENGADPACLLPSILSFKERLPACLQNCNKNYIQLCISNAMCLVTFLPITPSILFYLFGLRFYVPVNIFFSLVGTFSWVEPVLYKAMKMKCLAQGQIIPTGEIRTRDLAINSPVLCSTRFCSSTDFVQIEQKWLGQQPFLFIC